MTRLLAVAAFAALLGAQAFAAPARSATLEGGLHVVSAEIRTGFGAGVGNDRATDDAVFGRGRGGGIAAPLAAPPDTSFSPR